MDCGDEAVAPKLRTQEGDGSTPFRALEPDRRWPADSTAGKILKRHDTIMVQPRRQHRLVPGMVLGPAFDGQIQGPHQDQQARENRWGKRRAGR